MMLMTGWRCDDGVGRLEAGNIVSYLEWHHCVSVATRKHFARGCEALATPNDSPNLYIQVALLAARVFLPTLLTGFRTRHSIKS